MSQYRHIINSDGSSYIQNPDGSHHTSYEADEMEEAKEKMKTFRPSGDRGFHHSDIHKAAEELRMEGKGSEDPMYPNSKKNK